MFGGQNPSFCLGGEGVLILAPQASSRIPSYFIPRSTLEISLEPKVRIPQSEVSSHLHTGPGQACQEDEHCDVKTKASGIHAC